MTEQKIEEVHFDTQLANFTPRQMEAITLLDSGLIKFLLYGGALGGGKSYLLRWYGLRRLLKLFGMGFEKVTGMLACEDYPSLKDRQLQKIATEFPLWMGKMHGDHKDYGKAFILHPEYGSGALCFRNLDDASKYQSAEFAFILVDEQTKNLYEVFTFLRTRLRWPGLKDIECQYVGGTNPGGVGHGWTKQFWMDNDFPPEFIEPVDYRSQFAYVPSKADDNPYLDASYWAMLNTLPINLRKAFKEGDWDVFVGQAFPQFSKQIHVIRPQPVPKGAPIYMTFDWGYGAPFSIGFWWVDTEGRIYRFSEWYGWDGTPNQGIRLEDSGIAEGINKRKEVLEIAEQDIIELANPDCFQKKPDYKGGGQGPATAEVFNEANPPIYLSPADPSRQLKIRQFRERLRVQEDGKPMMYIYETCKQFIRTIANLVNDDHNIEDVDTTGEDHVYDEVCQICMARPLAMPEEKPPKTHADRHIEEIEEGGKTYFDEEEEYLAHNAVHGAMGYDDDDELLEGEIIYDDLG